MEKRRGNAAAGLSIVVPVFNEARGLAKFHETILDVARSLKTHRGLATEIIYVDDGSNDETSTITSGLQAGPADVQIVTLSRNFGKEAALLAGLDHARLGAVLFMDGDGQHPPKLVEQLVARWLEFGDDVVYTAKANRANEPLLRRAGVKWFYTLINWGARHPIPEDAGDFRLLSPRAVQALRRFPERNRFFKGLSSWIGFRQSRVDYEPAEREFGASTWNARRLIGLSIEGLTSFSVAPLRFASLLGMLIAFSALLFGFWIALQTLFFGKDVPGYPSLVVGIMVLGGVQLIMIGILGEYIGKLLSESKRRPVYFVAEHSVKTATEKAEPKPVTPHAAE
ncbi:MAG TPA: glycosyltransferase family 2 protein [Pseudolabrys sp.]|jgi:glycosyltransferase involved in cell wall biosynthesis|nr:glycosyltransferase family 2 protein [Pseudolabrys sp.]